MNDSEIIKRQLAAIDKKINNLMASTVIFFVALGIINIIVMLALI